MTTTQRSASVRVGQICVSPNRVYIEESVYAAFLEKAAAIAAK